MKTSTTQVSTTTDARPSPVRGSSSRLTRRRGRRQAQRLGAEIALRDVDYPVEAIYELETDGHERSEEAEHVTFEERSCGHRERDQLSRYDEADQQDPNGHLGERLAGATRQTALDRSFSRRRLAIPLAPTPPRELAASPASQLLVGVDGWRERAGGSLA